MKKQKVLIDTDIGDDIDDALALAFGLALDNIEIVGITTVFRNTRARARIARRILDLSGRNDIPVYAGYCDGLQRKNEPTAVCQLTDESDLEKYDALNPETDGGEGAVDFIIRMAEQYKEELIILGIGPYTNIAKALLQAPQTINSVGKIVVMGGTYAEHHLEWNILCDIEAADVLYSSAANLYCIGYDITKLTLVSADEERRMTKDCGGARGYLARLSSLWSKNCWHAPVLHDVLALYYISKPDILLMKTAEIKVETEGKYTKGMTVNLDNFKEGCTEYHSCGKTHIAVAADVEKFKETFMEKVFP